MAIDLEPVAEKETHQPPLHRSNDSGFVWDIIKMLLEPVASLRLTVVLFAFSIFLILAGTFAQVDKDIWEVIGQYFRCWFARIPLVVFFPPSFVPEMPNATDEVTAIGRLCISTMHMLKGLAETIGSIWFPGGKLIGLLLAANLLSAHLIRFKAVANGARLAIGSVALLAGCFVTWSIISMSGSSKTFQTDPWIPYATLWIGFVGFLGLLCLGGIYATMQLANLPAGQTSNPRRRLAMQLSAVMTAGLAVIVASILTGVIPRPSDASLRILWQLTQGGLASAGLLAGCWLVFDKRAGIVLLHSGIGLMMFYELHVAMTAIETQMYLQEGETTNFVSDIRTVELAVTDKSKADEDQVTVVPRPMISQGATFDLPEVPFKIEVKEYLPNSHIRRAAPGDTNVATAGLGKDWIADLKKPGSGTDMDSKIDMPSAYITLTQRSDGKSIGTYLVGNLLSMSNEFDSIDVDGKKYEVSLRPKRYYKSYQFTLKDVRKDDYVGTKTPRHYASTVIINDPAHNIGDQEKTIWMNNPLRFEDETFYQSNYSKDTAGHEHTTLTVVANSGWMMPYVACMLVAIGMLVHFLTILIRFLLRGETADANEKAAKLAERLGMATPIAVKPAIAESKTSQVASLAVTAGVVVLASTYFIATAIPPAPKLLDYDLYRFGQIPVVQDGRVKPLDSAAYAALLEISGKTSVQVGEGKDKQKLSAIQWFLDVIAEIPAAEHYEVFRVENLEVQETIGVKKREGMRYSRAEIRKNEKEFRKQVMQAREVAKLDRRQLNIYQRKLLELSDKVSTYDNLQLVFNLHHRIGGESPQEVIQSFQNAVRFEQMIVADGQAVLVIGPKDKDEQWRTFTGAWLENIVTSIRNKSEGNPAVQAWNTILTDYENSKRPEAKEKKRPQDFNKAVDDYLTLLEKSPPRDVNLNATGFEAFFNHFKPFTHADRLYVVAFVLVACGWLGWTKGFNRAAFWLLCTIFVVHTFALIGRIYISGRPPVTNLYSSAVFIGWGCVLLGLVLELVYRLGIGSLISAVAGYSTLLIADGLALKGDTFTVLQAVLDTQFWLATHVTTITLGYATTYLAGFLGIVYILRGVLTRSLTPEIARDLTRMIYGTLCFSIFFSFVGTVLGGLWADDSWGRFWGWDPKENGALIIVLWNALVLHARWGGIVKERGVAVLAIAGNIFVSWSWWGVNELGAGLHSYGFTEGTVIKLGLFVLSQLALIAVGLIPRQRWLSANQKTIG